MSDARPVITENQGKGVAVVRLNRPEALDALNPATTRPSPPGWI